MSVKMWIGGGECSPGGKKPREVQGKGGQKGNRAARAEAVTIR